MNRVFLLLFICSLFLGAKAQLQEPCVDSTRINPFYQCNDPSFMPVCGCNAVTYRNSCVAFNVAGVNTIAFAGVCSNSLFYSDIYPTVVYESFRFNMQFAPQETAGATLQIMNAFGLIVYSKLLNNISADFPYSETVSAAGFETGIYFCVVQARGVFQVHKFVKHAE